tara:strand:- start:6172 stop:6450 length:279 start_codon:yes stop_codon:yes gene_type:complete
MSNEIKTRPLFISQFNCSTDFVNALKGLTIHQIEYNYSEDFNFIEECSAKLTARVAKLDAALKYILKMQTRGYVVLGDEFNKMAQKALEDKS